MKVDVNELDRRIYETELKGFLPEKILDAHVHLFDSSSLSPDYRALPKSVYEKFGGCFRLEDFKAYGQALLPGHELYVNHFGHPHRGVDRDKAADYTGLIADNVRSFGMALVAPRDGVEAVRERVVRNRLIGYKPYLSLVDGIPANDVTIFDMLPPDQMAYADARGLAIMLHIPRAERLADPVNQRDMVEICRRYPGAKIIFAHIGRAYYRQGVAGFLDGIARCPNAFIDTAMVNHEGVLEYAFMHFPRERILWGSDAPVAFLRGKSIEVNNQYAYLMGEDYAIGTSIFDANHAVQYTSFFYEQLRGVKLAAERAGLARSEVEALFLGNAHGLFSGIVRNLERAEGV